MSELVERDQLAHAMEADELPYAYIAGLHQRFDVKLFNPALDETATSRLSEQREIWNDTEAVTVFTSGAFDMLHMDHAAYLLHTKATGAPALFKRMYGKAWGDLPAEWQVRFTTCALSSHRLRLIVSVDGDKSVATKKGNKPEYGNTTRPIYSWRTRALMVASQAYMDPSDKDGVKLLPTADAVTIHGPQDFPTDSPHASHFALVEYLQPNVWAFFGQSREIPEEAPRRPALGRVALRCIADGPGTHYFEDGFLGKISTTKIIERALGEL